MDRTLNEVTSQNAFTGDNASEALLKQFSELDQLQLAMVGGGIADVIGI